MSAQDTPRKISRPQLEYLLKSQLGADLVVKDFTWAPNTKPGENYGSIMLALTIRFCQTVNSAEQTLNIVAKLAPQNKFLQKVFDFENTFCKEMNFYKLVSPELEKIQKDCEIPDEDSWNIVAKFYGAQTSSKHPNSRVDESAILLLENLKVSGYKLADRLNGLDLKHCELVITKLAQFHALPIVLKQKKQQVFENTVLKATAFSNFEAGTGNPKKDIESILKSLPQVIPECIPHVERIRTHCLEYTNIANKSLQKEPFATIVHNDFWTNNMMFLYNNTKDKFSPISVKFVDFQVTLLCSPIKDLIFFLFSSTEDSVLRENYDHLINLYYTNFIRILERTRCDISAFSLQTFHEEINEFAPTQFFHVLLMLSVIYAKGSDIKNPADIDDTFEVTLGTSNTCKQKIVMLIEEFDKRGWLKKSP